MSDNRTTELTATECLRTLLDERGVEWKSGRVYNNNTSWDVGDSRIIAKELTDGTLLIQQYSRKHFTPEQAIAATLGDDDYEHRMDELLCRLTNGKWSKSRSYTVDFMVSCVDEAYEDATLGDQDATAFCKRIEKSVAQREPLTLFGVDYSATLGGGKLTAEQVVSIAGKHQPDYCSDTHVCFDWQAIADELNATLGSGTCHMNFIDEYERQSGDEDYLCECSECGSQMWEPAHDLPLYCRKCGRAVKR